MADSVSRVRISFASRPDVSSSPGPLHPVVKDRQKRVKRRNNLASGMAALLWMYGNVDFRFNTGFEAVIPPGMAS
jgi:hypothetical protein